MKNSVRVSGPMVLVLFAVAFVTILVFTNFWLVRRNQMTELVTEEMELRGDLEQLETWGRWTIEYVKIDKALAYLSKGRISPETRAELTELIWKNAHSYSTDPLLILAVVAQESHGNPNARGRMQSGAFSGALGLMQIKLETAQKMGRRFGLNIETTEDLMKPEVNVIVGTAYLIRLIAKYGNWKDALVAYNIGHSAVDRMQEQNRPLPTGYYENVMAKYWNLSRIDFLADGDK